MVYYTPRLLDAPLALGAYEAPAGSFVSVLISHVHHDPAAFPEPEQFRPERFLNGTGAGPQKGWIPFGGGRRYCPGAQLATLELKVIIREVLRRVDLVPASQAAEKQRVRNVTLVPSRLARVIAQPRSPSHG